MEHQGAHPPLMCTHEGGVLLAVLVQPGASRSRILGVHGGRVKVALSAPPVDGKANAALVALLSRALGVPKGHLRVTHGRSSRRKRIFVEALTPGGVSKALSLSEGG